MTLEEQFKKETDQESYEYNNLQPKIYTDCYVEWLEEKLEEYQLREGSQKNI